MSLTEQDREILLQEIQQIQRTLEATGRKFGGDAEEYSSDEDDQEDDTCDEQNLYYPTNLKQEENFDEDVESLVQTPSSYNDYTYNSPSQSANGELLVETGSNIGYPENTSTPNINRNLSNKLDTPTVASSEKLTTEGVPRSSISAKLKRRIKQESEFGSKLLSSKSKGKDKKHAPSNDSIDTSSVQSHSLPTRQLEKITMANLYIERIFGGFRNKKSKPSYLAAFGDEKYGGKDLRSSANLSTLENLLQVNRRYKELLTDELKKVELAIARNRRAQDEVTTSMKNKEVKLATFASLSKACIGRFGKPYFKDNEGVGPPDNEDTLEKKRNMKVNPFKRGAKHWKSTETAELEKGVYHNNLEKRLEPWMKKLKQFDKEYKEKQKQGEKMDKGSRHLINKEIAKIKELPRSEILIDPSQIDFFKISKNFLPTRDEFECRVQWCNVAHPSINQTKFSKDEDGQLIKLAKKSNNHQWEDIAKELGTNRTPIQCLQRFQRTLNREMIKTAWEEEDDEVLREAVSSHGNNWVLVASVLGNRTGDQCMHRWIKTVDPSIKRGKWSDDEDKCLLAAVEKYGSKNWKEVRKCVAGRTDAQCRERYVSSLDPSKDWGAFNEEEDQKILELVDKHGLGKWAAIAKEFPNRRDNQIWRRYTQLDGDRYHKYRRGVIWKRRSVLNYFFHRGSEKRDYSLEELDVTYSPSLSHMESRKLERMREELVKCGYTEDEITKKLARMHYEGLFSRSIYKARQRPNSQGRNKCLNAGKKGNTGKLASRELISGINDVLATVKDPSAELPPPPVEPLKRKTKVEREVNIDGFHVIPKPKLKRRGRKEKWLESKVNGDIFRRKCHEVLMKYKSKTIWHDDAVNTLDNYYKIVQVEGNSFFHKQILNIYTEISAKLETAYTACQEIEEKLLTEDEIPIIRTSEDDEYVPPVKREPGRPRGVKNGTTSKKKEKKITTFKKMVLDASRDVRIPARGAPQIDIMKIKRESAEEINEEIPEPCPNSSPLNVTTSTSVTNQEDNIDSNRTSPQKQSVEVPVNKTPAPFTSMSNVQTVPLVFHKSGTPPVAKENPNPPPVPPYNISPVAQQNFKVSPTHARDESNDLTQPAGVNSFPDPPFDGIEEEEAYLANEDNSQSESTEAMAPNEPSCDKKTPSVADSHLVTKDNIKVEPQSVPEPTPKGNVNDAQHSQGIFLTDKLKTFTLLLQALHVDTSGVMNVLSRNNPSSSGVLSSNLFPTCYPLSPNSASLLGFRKLLLHRRILGEVLKKDKMVSDRLGIPVARDRSYQNTKAYDALRKRFRSLFTWPAFLATFIPKYIETPDISKSISLENIPNPNRTIVDPTSMNKVTVSTPYVRSPSPRVSSSPVVTEVTSKTSDSEEIEENGEETCVTEKPEKGEKLSFVDQYIQKRKLETDNKMKKKLSKNTSTTTNRRKRNNENPSVVITPCKKISNEPVDVEGTTSDDDDDDECQITRHVSKRLSQKDDYQRPLKKRKKRRRKDDRQANSQTGIFIPPAVAVKVENVDDDLSVEIVENNEAL